MLLTLMSLINKSIFDFDRFRSYWHTFDRKLNITYQKIFFQYKKVTSYVRLSGAQIPPAHSQRLSIFIYGAALYFLTQKKIVVFY